MRHLVLSLCLVSTGLAACATKAPKPVKPTPSSPSSEMPGLDARKLSPGECGLFVWTADAAKTFTLFAGDTQIAVNKDGEEVILTEKNPTDPPALSREFMDADENLYRLTLLAPNPIEGGTRYGAGRLMSLDEEGWEKVVPVIGLTACQPVA